MTESVASIELVNSSALSWHSAAIVTKHDGSTLLYMWGDNSFGQLGDETTKKKENPTRTKTSHFTSPIKQVTLGAYNSAVILADGSLYAWGHNVYGQLGTIIGGNKNIPTLVDTSKFTTPIVKQVALGAYHTAALLADGSLYAWGYNSLGQLGTIGGDNRTPTPVDTSNFTSPIKQVALGAHHSAAILDDGSLYAWGDNYNGQLGTIIGGNKNIPTPVDTSNFTSPIKQLALGVSVTAALLDDGSLYTWGLNDFDQLGTTIGGNKDTPTPVDTSNFTSPIVEQVALGEHYSAALLDDGSLYTWGRNDRGQLGTIIGGNKSIPTPVDTSNFTTPIVKQVVLGAYHTAVILTDGSLYAWGNNYYGQLGDGTFNNTDVPTLSNLGKDSHITANSDLTAEQAVNKSWVNGTLDLDGFKQSFNLINIPDVPDQTITMDSKPIPNNKNRSVTIKIKIKYFYDQDGLKIPDNTEIPLTITGFKIPFVDSSITLLTSYMNSTDYGLTAKQLESSINSANTIDEKITLLENYIDFNLENQSDGSPATITSISTTPPINKNGELEVTFNLDNYYENGILISSKPITINDLRKTSSITPNTNYATETAKFLTSQFITNLAQQKTPAEFETFLKPYLDIDFPTPNNQYNERASITSATAKETTNPEEIELFIELADYYDETSSELKPNLTFVLDGFIKPSSINIKSGYETAAATTTVHNLIGDLTASNLTSDDYKNLLSPYLEFNFNTNTEITSVTTTNTTAADKANGIFKFSLGLANYYEAANQVTSKDFTLNGFIRTSSITQKAVPTNDAKNISAKSLAASLTGPHSSDQYKTILEPFLDFKLATQTLGNKPASIINVITSNINDTLGSLTVRLELKDFYNDNGAVTSLPFNLTGLALSSSITKTADAEVQAASMTIKNLQDQLIPGADYEDVLSPFLVFNFTAQTAPNEVATITDVTFDDKLTNSANGELGIILHLDNYLEDGILLPTKTITLVGFKKVSSITIKTGYKKYAVNTTAKELAKTITTTTTIEQQTRVLNNYLSFQVEGLISSVVKAINVINEETLSAGILNIRIDLDNYYDEQGNLVSHLEFDFEGFSHFHFDPQQKPLDGHQETAEQVLEILLNGSETVIDTDNLSRYVDLRGLTPNSLITITSTIINPDGSLTLNLSVDIWYSNDLLQKSPRDFTVHLSGFKIIETNQSKINWWIYVLIGLGVLLLLIVFIILIRRSKQKDKKFI